MQRPEVLSVAESLRLRLLKKGRVVRSFRVKAKTLTIGSGARASVRIKGIAGLAPEHALIWLDGGTPTLVPSSDAVVLVNGSRITQFTRLRPRDLISLGELDLQVEASLAPSVEVEPPEPTSPEIEAVRPFFDDDDERTVPDMALADQLRELAAIEAPAARPVEAERQPQPLGDPFEDESLLTEPRLPTFQELASPAAPPEQEPFEDDDDDDEDNELDFVEPFSLVGHLEQKLRSLASGPREGTVVAQVVRHSEGRVWGVETVRPGQQYRSGPGAPALLSMGTDGACTLTLRPEMSGRVGRGELESRVSTLLAQAGSTRLSEGDWASLETPDANYLIQITRPPRSSRPSLGRALANAALMLVYAVAVTVVAGGGALAFAPSARGQAAQDGGATQTTEVEWQSLTMLPPNLDVPEDEPAEPEVEDIADQSQDEANTERGPPPRTRRTARNSQSGGRSGSAASKLLASLQGGGGGRGPAFGDIVTSIDSIGNDSPGLFNIPGMPQSLPGDEVKIARRGPGGGPETIGASQLRSSNPFLGVLQKTGRRTGRIRGRPTVLQARPSRSGAVDPAEVRRAINARIGAITRCYESRLMQNESLAGRVVIHWTLTPSGSASGVRVQATTVGDPLVGNCVAGVIRGIHFPRPTGGPVQISFPFMFRSIN